MKIERLFFQVNPPGYASDFLQADSEVWNPWLKRQPGFLNKTSRLLSSGLVELNIFWRSEQDMAKASSKKKEMKLLEVLMRQRYPGTHRLVFYS